jgi:tRNA1(Val) A37 N6-methylase TrmN6
LSRKSAETVESAAAELSVDGFLGGKVEAVQPARGHHRSGLEAVLLAASIDSRSEGCLVDLGAGAGVAGLCAAARCAGVFAVLVEREPLLVACARLSLERDANAAFAGRVAILEADIAGRAVPWAATGDEVLINPPFHDERAGSASPARARAAAHILGEEGLEAWIKAAAAILKPRGRMTMIFRADRLDALLSAIAGRFGGLDILPIQPRAAAPAHRVIVSARKGSRAPLQLLPPLILHGDKGNAFRPEIDALLRDETEIGEIHAAWLNRR